MRWACDRKLLLLWGCWWRAELIVAGDYGLYFRCKGIRQGLFGVDCNARGQRTTRAFLSRSLGNASVTHLMTDALRLLAPPVTRRSLASARFCDTASITESRRGRGRVLQRSQSLHPPIPSFWGQRDAVVLLRLRLLLVVLLQCPV
jgi:hypothetical protein